MKMICRIVITYVKCMTRLNASVLIRTHLKPNQNDRVSMNKIT